jgi:hypothetical protein
MKSVPFLAVLSLLAGLSSCASTGGPNVNLLGRTAALLGIDANSIELSSECEYAVTEPDQHYARLRSGVAACTADSVYVLDQSTSQGCRFRYADIDYLRADDNKYVRQVQLVSSGRLLVFSNSQGLFSNRKVNSRFYSLIQSKGVRVSEKAIPVTPPPPIVVPIVVPK